ncbi:MAG: hypothetical protein Q4F11_09225 [Eubacteriales bacterium]|nr:hypothetical protein [Eubacteriales bacterium]
MQNKNIRMIVSLVLNLLIIIIGVYVVFTVGTKAYSFGNKIFNEQAVDMAGDAREVEITVTDGMSAKKLAKLLCDKGLTNDETITYFQIRLSDYYNKIPAGTYTLTTDMTPTDMLETMGESVNEPVVE